MLAFLDCEIDRGFDRAKVIMETDYVASLNGHRNDDMEKIQEDIFYLRESLGVQVSRLASAVEAMTANIQGQTRMLDVYIRMQKWAIPLPLVTMMFAVLLGLIFGKETIEWFFDHKLFMPEISK